MCSYGDTVMSNVIWIVICLFKTKDRKIKHNHMCIYTLSIGMFQHEYLLLENT